MSLIEFNKNKSLLYADSKKELGDIIILSTARGSQAHGRYFYFAKIIDYRKNLRYSAYAYYCSRLWLDTGIINNNIELSGYKDAFKNGKDSLILVKEIEFKRI